MSYRSKLEAAYRSFFGSNNNTCPYAEQCAKGMCEDSIRFNCAHLGKDYGTDPSHPKILVVGKEPVSEHRYIQEPVSLENAKYNHHYLKTLYILSLLFDHPADDYNKCDSLLSKEPLLSRMCLTNYYKCVFAKTKTENGTKSTETRHNRETNTSMKTHCAEILIEEIRALTPDLVVIQGKDADNKTFRKLIDTHFQKGVKVFEENGIWLYKHEYEDGSFYILWSYHPTARSNLWAKKLETLKAAISCFKDHFSKSL